MRPTTSDESPRAHTGRPGVAPSEMLGKVLKSIRVSRAHPTVTLRFADRTSFQIRVEGYDPSHPGPPKTIETSPALESLLAWEGNLGYTVANATMITMTDHAFETGKKERSWEQRHAGVAFKFAE